MRRLKQRKPATIAAAVAVALAVGGLGAYAAASSGSEPEATPVEQLAAEPTGPGRFARAYDLNPAEATAVFELRNGETVSVVANATAKCLIRAVAGGSSEGCDTIAAINEGQAIWVADECGSSGQDRMAITGLAPADASSVQLDSSDGSHEEATVVGGAFKFEGTNPESGGSYPTGVKWIAAGGGDIGAAPLPVESDHFCLPTS